MFPLERSVTSCLVTSCLVSVLVRMGSAVERTDKHVREYLLYRGFTSTLKQLDSDIKADKEKGFRVRWTRPDWTGLDLTRSDGFSVPQVDRIIEQLQQLVQSFDLAGLKEYWLYLDRRLFCRLEDVYRSTVNKLRTSLYRYYVINTIQVWHLIQNQLPVSQREPVSRYR